MSCDMIHLVVYTVNLYGVDEYDVNSNTRIGLPSWSFSRSRASMHTSYPTFPVSRVAPARSKAPRASISTASSSAGGATWRRWPRPLPAAASNARLKDEFGANPLQVQGATKVMGHLMFGILALAADQLMRLRH